MAGNAPHCLELFEKPNQYESINLDLDWHRELVAIGKGPTLNDPGTASACSAMMVDATSS
jgi:hypothetical protein